MVIEDNMYDVDTKIGKDKILIQYQNVLGKNTSHEDYFYEL